MEPFEREELSDRELDGMLPQWKAPDAPARLRSAVFPKASLWRRIWGTSIRIPMPVACTILALLVVAAIQWPRTAPARVVVRTERVEVPVVQERVVTRTVYRDRPALAWTPVRELRPRIIRSGHDRN